MTLTDEQARHNGLLVWLSEQGMGMYQVQPYYENMEHGSQLARQDLPHLSDHGLLKVYLPGGSFGQAELTPEGRMAVERLQGDPEQHRAERLRQAEALLHTAREALAATQGMDSYPTADRKAKEAIDAYFKST
jgi:hypothetical protein